MRNRKHPLAVWREAQTPPLSQEAFGRLCNVTKWTINSLETGRRKPSIELIRRVSNATSGAIGFDQLAGEAA
jgi:DNA-binding XRE family transcriptional regulator